MLGSGSKKRRAGVQGTLLYMPAILIIFGIVVYPMLYALVMSFTGYSVRKPVMNFIGVANYIKILKDASFWQAVVRSLMFTFGSLIPQVVLGLAIAILLNHPDLRCKGLFRGLVIMPWLVPTVAVAMIFRWMFHDVYGIMNYILMKLHILKEPVAWMANEHMVLWATQEMNMIHVADGYISISSIMPQKRNPIALEHLRSSLSVLKGMTEMVLTGFLKSPYGDISDYEDIEDGVLESLELFNKNARLFEAVISTLDVNKELLEKRAYESFSVVTDIADQMYRSYKIPFRRAHSFVSFLVKKAGKMEYNLRNISEEFFASSYEEFFDEPFKHDFTPISRCIDPWHFVRSREVRGGTGEKAMESMIERAKKEIEADQLWIHEHREQLHEADEKRKQVIRNKLGS